MSDLRAGLTTALAAFLPSEASAKAGGAQPLTDAARALFATLGYSSKRTLRIVSVKQFCEHWDTDGTLTAKERTSLNRLSELHFLFQLTDAELSTQNDLFTDPGTVDGTRIHSYLFLAAELPAGTYSRTDLTAIARALNKPLKMPALVLFKHGECLSLAVLHRRLNKTSADRDVLEKATLIKDIRCAAPHRAHVEILADLAFDSLKAAHSVTNFIQLHAAWRETLDIQELNKRFYRELQHWYFWALGHVRFPDGAPKDADDRDSLSLIRLLTRLIFVWFLKEKGLVPENLFDARVLPKLLKGFAPASAKDKDSVYYRAVLQNLFFATLNCEPDQRGWARDGQNMMAHSLYRFREDFASAATALDLFKDIPFLNGGLFECLDKDLGEGTKPRYVRIDGFSRRDDSQPVVPDFLFFGPEQDADLSDFYEEKKSGKKARPVRVRGLIEIFHDFKFTIEENTPLEEDVALDPELLGRVFENLLAAYNPETQVTARKQTGSFYTPREIVDYMTGQALFYALREKLQSGLATKSTKGAEPGDDSSAASAFDQKLQSALAHDDAPNPFNTAETGQLIAALDELKILDPACGSGAFPMGVLHRLVHLLGKLDPRNEKWKGRQILRVRKAVDAAAKIEDASFRERAVSELEKQEADIESAFGANELGYGRKLYLIENCLYGVDIQPIAAQIAKLRFFISLVVEQRTDPAAPNRGIRPLPNLETKIVAANTLLGIARPGQQLLRNLDIDTKEAELRHVRDEHFLARTPKKKAKCREDDARLRKEIATLLKDDGWDSATAKKLSAWDPYDQNAHADFFDNEWMFGLTEGFDVVIGNPPYGADIPQEHSKIYRSRYESVANSLDTFIMFIERAAELLGTSGALSYIVPSGWVSTPSCSKLRLLFTRSLHPRVFVSLPYDSFSNAYIDTMVVVAQRLPSNITWSDLADTTLRLVVFPIRHDIKSVDDFVRFEKTSDFSLWTNPDENGFLVLASSQEAALVRKLRNNPKTFADYTDVMRGIETYHPGARAKLHSPKPALTGDIYRYELRHGEKAFIDYSSEIAAGKPWRYFGGPRLLLRQLLSRKFRLQAVFAEEPFLTNQSVQSLIQRDGCKISLPALLGFLNSRIISWFFCQVNMVARRDDFPKTIIKQTRELPLPDLEELRKGKALSEVESLVSQILAAKRVDAGADTSAPEAEIDRHVYALYGLTPEEIKIVEGSNPPTP